MKVKSVSRVRNLMPRLELTLLLILTCSLGYSQSVDCSNGNNCNNPFCDFEANVEQGCNCFDGIDNDGDGKIDKADLKCAQYYGLTFVGGDEGDCSLVAPVGNPFSSMAPPTVSGQNTADTQSKVSVGDLDGDGLPDVVITSKWNQEIRVVATAAHTVNGITYAPGDIKGDFKTTGQGAKIFDGSGGCSPKSLLFEHENLIANIDKTGPAELFAIVSNRSGSPKSPPTCFFLLALRYQAGGLVPLYDAVNLGPNRPGVFGIADMDGDGKAELYIRDRIYAAETGVLLATGNGDWDLDITSGPVAVDVIKGDGGKMELVCGTKIYSIPNLSNRTPATPATLTLARDMNTLDPAIKAYVKLSTDPVEYGEDTHSMCSVADVDNDGTVDVIISGALNSVTGKTAVFYWNVAKNKVSYFIAPDAAYPNGWPWGTGRVNLIDSDNDHLLDMFFVAGSTLFRVETVGDSFHPDINTNGGVYSTYVTTRTINDSRSGVLTVTLYDFNNDGQFELVYRDSQELVVVDSETMQTKYWSATCQSHTYTEGPVIADVNGDGATDICVACNRNNSFDIQDGIQQQALGELRLFFSSTNAWLPTRKVWNQPGYFVININDNLTLPFPQYDQTTVFSEGTCESNGLSGPQRPLNTFLNQLPYISASGCPVFPSPDLTFYGDDPAQPGVDTNGDGQIQPSVIVIPPICGNTNVSVQFNVINSGLLPITASVPVSFYNGNPTLGPTSSTLLHTTTLNLSLPVGVTTLTAPVTFNGPGSEFDMYIVLNNTGFPVPASGQSETDCDLENNIQQVLVTPTPFSATAMTVQDNTVCVPTDMIGEVKVDKIFKGTTEVTDWSQYNFQWYDGPAAGPHTIRTGATNYNLQGLAAGTYTVIATHKTIGCNSAPVDAVVVDNVLAVPYTLNKISDQTQCTPFDGELELDFNGADLTGVSIVWRDANSNEIVAENVTSITGLKGDILYQVTVSRGTCSSSQFQPLTAPTYPRGVALHIRDVMNCLNPESGKVSARAIITDELGNDIHDPDTTATKYQFTWYNFVNGTRQSPLPNQPTEGPSAWNLPIGSYEVVVTNLLTNCTSVDPVPFVTVNEGFTLPTAQVDRLRPQTSCDPEDGNAALRGVALENGTPATDQNQYHFYWYEGQNTITRLRDPANTEIDNPILDDVAGGVKGGGLAYTVQVVHRETGCAATAFNTAEEIINYPIVSLDSLNNDICPNDLAIPFTGQVNATVTFAGQAVSDFTNYTFKWYNGSMVDEAQRVPDAASLQQLVNLAGGLYTLQVEETALKCPSVPVPIQVLDVLSYPVLTQGVTGSTNCTTPPTPDGNAFVATVDGTTVPSTGNLSPYTFKWYNGSTVTPANEITGTGNLGFLAQLQGSNDPTLANYTVAVSNAKGCASTLTIHVPDNRELPLLELTPSPNANCAEGNGVLFTGKVDAIITNQKGSIDDYAFSWTNATLGNRDADGAAGAVWNNLSAGSYSVRVLHKVSGCESPLSNAIVTDELVLPVIDAVANGSTNCAPFKPGNGSVAAEQVDGTLATSVLSDYSFQWFTGSDTDGAILTTQYASTATIQGAPDAFYTVRVTKLSNNCANTATIQVPDISARPIITLGQDPNVNCENFNGAAYVTGITYKGNPYTNIANVQYAWFDGSGITSPRNPQVNMQRLESLEGGMFYSATVTMVDEGCTSDYVAIEVGNGIVYPDVNTSITASMNCPGGVPDGSASVAGVSPAGSYEYRWYAGSSAGSVGTELNDNTADVDISDLQGGATAYFTVEAKNTATFCARTETVLIPDQSVLPSTALSPTDNPNCPVFPDGTVNPAAGRVDVTTVTYNGNVIAAPYDGFTFIWSGTGSPAEAANIPTLAQLAAGTYSLQIKHVQRNCVSDPVSASVLDAQVFPDVSTILTPQTSCDDVNHPNGAVAATVTGGPVGFETVWFRGIGIGGTMLTEVSEGVITQLRSDDYTVRVHNITTACTTTETVLVPNNITLPELSWANLSPMTRCDNPNGDATPSVANVVTPDTDFTLYYIFTPEGQTYPADPSVIRTTGTQRPGTTAGPQAVIDQLSPGYVTALVRDNINHCESDPLTVQIENATIDVVYNLGAKYKAGLCSTSGGGGIDMSVTGGVGPFQYHWYEGTPANTDINFYNNPPDISPALQVNTDITNPNLGNPNGTPAAGVKAGVYTFVVKDQGNGCGAYVIESVPLLESPEFDVTKVDVTTCDDPGNGIINVEVTQAAGSPDSGPFEIQIFSGINDATTSLISQSGESFTVNLPGLMNGEYYVKLIDHTMSGGIAINEACPLGKGIILDQEAFGPVVNLSLDQPNTSCDPANLGDGIVTVLATAQPQDQTMPDYEISAIDPLAIGFTTPHPIAAGAGEQVGGFGTGTYQITVRDINTRCLTEAFIMVPDRPQIPEGLNVAVTPDSYCAPASNGRIQVTGVAPGNVGDYEFTWYDNADLTTALYGQHADNFYDNTKSGWKFGPIPGFGNGTQTYYVRGVKVNGPGEGCPTPIVMAVVNDTHIAPVPALTARPNTSCIPGVNEGIVTLLASTPSTDAAVQSATYEYVFNNGPAQPGMNGTTAETYASLSDNTGVAYPVVVMNETNYCIAATAVTVQSAQFSFNITQNTVAHQLICNNDGDIEVTQIVLNRSLTSEPNVTYGASLTDDFDFTWFKAPAGSPGSYDSNSPLQDNTAANIVTESLSSGTNPGQFPGMEAGSYYVIATRKPTAPGAGCATPPYRVDVFDQHVNPTVALTPFTNTSCDPDPVNAEGSIVVRVTADATAVPGPFTYEYNWTSGNVSMPYPNVNDGDGSSSDNDNDNPIDLVDGIYSLTVTNLQTGCEVAATTTVTKNETPVFLTEAESLPQEICDNSGSVEVKKIEVMYPDPNIGVQPAPLPDFTYTWTRDGVEIVQSNNVLLDVNAYADIEAGTYYVTATRSGNTDGGPGFGCSSAPYRVDILERIKYPNITVVPFANSACADDANFFEGSASITIQETGVGAGATYEYTWSAGDPSNTSLVLTQNPKPTGLGNVDLQAGLRDDNYSIDVFNPITGCIVTAQTIIIKTAIPVVITEAGSTPKPICLPSGSAFVTRVIVGGAEDPNFNNFDFSWSEGTLDNLIVSNQQGIATLDNVSYNSIGQASLTYYVSAVRRIDAVNPDNSPAIGRGCSSPPVMVTIQDQSRTPAATFQTAQNTSCNDLSPNGSIRATASDPSGSTNFDFTWTLNGGAIPPTLIAVDNGVENGWNRIPEGLYAVNVYNVDTGCDIDLLMPVELNQRASFPNIIEVVPTSPIDCNNSGSALVTRIYIGNEENAEIPGIDSRFTYTWYTAYTDAATNAPIGGQIEEHLNNVGPGKYFVTVMDTFEDRNCPSGPNQVEIDDPIENYPVPVITESLPQISCRPDEGTAQLIASADGGNTGNPYIFSWYRGLGAADGNELLDGNNVQYTGSMLDNVDDGHYSVRVYNSVTNCIAETYYIIENKHALFYPQLMLSTGPRTNCVDPDGVLEVKEVGFTYLNTTDAAQPNYYRFAPNFSADYVLSPMDQAGTSFDNDMTPAQGFDQLANRTWVATNLDAFDVYTVKVTDESTGCFVIDEIRIPDKRENPIVAIQIDNPLINCYSAQPNGQLTAIADGGKPASGYEFFWHAGTTASGTPIGTNDKLIGVGTENNNPDLWFTVRVVNRLTQCEAELSQELPDQRVPGEAPTAYTVQDDSRCDIDDGWVTAHVDNITFTHNFYWFNGNVTSNKSETELLQANNTEADYRDIGANFYTVYAQNRETGCISVPIVTEVKDITVIPQLIFETTASYCEDVPYDLGGGRGNGTITLTLDPADVVSDEILWVADETGHDAGTGNYITGLFPGWYTVDVTTTKGCVNTGRTEVPTDIRNYNLVTRNNDGKNDTWIIDCISRFPTNNVKIFNRSGVLVYEADGYDNANEVFQGIGKRGVYMAGNELPVGTYFYIIDKRDGSRPRTGYLELVK